MKSHLTKRELKKFEDLLKDERERMFQSVSRSVKAIQHEDDESSSGAGRAHSNHMADQGSDEIEYETHLVLSASQTGYLREIEAALQRIEDGTYGICEVNGIPIGKERLEAIPTARLSIEAAEEEEMQRFRKHG